MLNARVRCSVAATLTRSVRGALRPVCWRRGAAHRVYTLERQLEECHVPDIIGEALPRLAAEVLFEAGKLRHGVVHARAQGYVERQQRPGS